MRSVLIAALIFILPLTCRAQITDPGVQPAPPASASPAQLPLPGAPNGTDTQAPFLCLTRDQAIAIGYGVVAGAVVTHFLIGGVAATAAGIVGGALVGAWWHDQYGRSRPNIRANLPTPAPAQPRPTMRLAALDTPE
jgi:hypothetical protein